MGEFEKADALFKVGLIYFRVIADKLKILKILMLLLTAFRGLPVGEADIIPATGCPGVERSILSQNGV